MKIIPAIFILILCCLPISAQENIIRHVVQSGETIESISLKYGITKAEIVELNPTAERYLYTGQELSISLKPDSLYTEDIISELDSIKAKTVPVQESVKKKPARYGLFKEGIKLPFMVTQGIGIYTRPNDARGRYRGLSATLFGVGNKFPLSDDLFLQGSLNLEMDYQVSKAKGSVKNPSIDATYEYKRKDFSSSICFPIQCGFSVGSFIVRGGVLGRYTWIGKQRQITTLCVNDITNVDDNSTRYKKAENVDRFTYGLTFDITSNYYKDTQEGLNIRIVKSKNMKRPMALFSFIIYY